MVAGDQTRALMYLNASAQSTYANVFSALASRMPSIVGSYSGFQRSELGSEFSEYAVNRTIDGVNRIFFVSFLLDENGIWRLDSM